MISSEICDDPTPISEIELWSLLGEYDLARVEWSFCTILQFVRKGARFAEKDPITRLWYVLLLRGEKVTITMLVNYVNTVGYRIAHPHIHELIAKKRTKLTKVVSGPSGPTGKTKTSKGPAKPRNSHESKPRSFHLGDPDAEAALLACCARGFGDHKPPFIEQATSAE